MPHQYSTALSHMILAGTGLYCLIQYRHGEICQLPCAMFGIIITNSVLGIWRWGNPDHGDKLEKPYNFTFYLQTIFVMPCIAGQIWLMNGYEQILAYLHPMLSCIPFTAYFADKNKCGDVIDFLMFLKISAFGFDNSIDEKKSRSRCHSLGYFVKIHSKIWYCFGKRCLAKGIGDGKALVELPDILHLMTVTPSPISLIFWELLS
ncbi:hypothetical protein QE152_g12664 [Popillia japonica]|uniref:Uncharacterized protein n=1 Tax=Popillia japonica TaxID=7064 RepID=A0AAW1LQN6_POPJA